MNSLQKILGIGAFVLALNGCAPPNIPVTNAVTTSAKDYCESVGKSLKDYNIVGVYGNAAVSDSSKLLFKGEVPVGTEIVTDIKLGDYAITGTALIPKKPSN